MSSTDRSVVARGLPPIGGRSLWLLRVAVAALFYAASFPAHAAGGSLEYAVKAAYLSKFGDFVEWPKGAFKNPSSPLNLCVVGHDPFGDVLDKVVDDRRAADHPIVVRRLAEVRRDSDCQIVFIAGSDEQSVEQTLADMRGTATLTVTDDEHSVVPAIIRFVLKDDRVRFDIDDGAAAQNGLTISAELLKLALTVTPRK